MLWCSEQQAGPFSANQPGCLMGFRDFFHLTKENLGETCTYSLKVCRLGCGLRLCGTLLVGSFGN